MKLFIGSFFLFVLAISSMGVLVGGLIAVVSAIGMFFGMGSAMWIFVGGIILFFSAVLCTISFQEARECIESDVWRSKVYLRAQTKRFFTMSVWQLGLVASFTLFVIGLIWSVFR